MGERVSSTRVTVNEGGWLGTSERSIQMGKETNAKFFKPGQQDREMAIIMGGILDAFLTSSQTVWRCN